MSAAPRPAAVGQHGAVVGRRYDVHDIRGPYRDKNDYFKMNVPAVVTAHTGGGAVP